MWSDLRHRTQAEKEKISAYILSLRHLVRHLAYPPSEQYFALLAYRNLHPTYRDALANRVPMTLEELETWGMQFEKLQKLNCRWSAPPSADRMHIAYAAPKKQTTRKSAAAASVSGEVAAVTWASAPSPPQQQKPQQQQRPQQPSPTPQQPAAGAKAKGR